MIDPSTLQVEAYGGLSTAAPCGGVPCTPDHVVAWLDALDAYVDAAAAEYERKRLDRGVGDAAAQAARKWMLAAMDIAYAGHYKPGGEDSTARVSVLIEGAQLAEAARQVFLVNRGVPAQSGGGAVVGLTLAGGLAVCLVALVAARRRRRR